MISRTAGLSVALVMAIACGCQRAKQETAQRETVPAQDQQASIDVAEVSQLIAQLTDDDPRTRALAARNLGESGDKSSAESLAALVADENATVRRAAIAALHQIQPGDEMIVPLMTEMLRDADPHVVALATHSLAESGPDIVPAMIKAMEDEQIIYLAILVLSELGPDAKPAVPALVKALAHQDAEVRHEAAQALRSIGPGALAAVPDLIKALDDEQIAVQLPSLLALGSIGPEAKDALDKVGGFKDNADDLLRVCALWAIEKIDPNEERLKTETTPELVNLLLSENQAVRNAAALAVLQLEPGADVVAPLFAEAYEEASDEARADMLDAAASLGGKVVPRLLVGLDNPDTRRQTIEILGKIGPAAAEAVPELLKHVDDDDPAVRADIFITLGHIGPAAKAATDAATKALQDSEEEVQSSAAYALGNIDPDASACVDEITQLMESDNPRFTTVCAWALVRIDPENADNIRRAIPLLIQATGHEQAFVRVEAASTLGMIGPAAKEAIAPLQNLADDPDPDVRSAAAEAIEMIAGQQ
jgi:HEAT repeat protein